jgi:two-component system, LytTR family, response regulator LytT
MHNFKVLIVEDEAIIAENIKITVTNLGYAVVGICYDANQAIAAIQQIEFDIALVDIYLKDAEAGFTIAQVLKQKDIPFIFLTAFTDTDTIKKAATYNPSSYLTKPVNATNLFSALQIAFFNHEKILGTIDDYFFMKHAKGIKRIAWKSITHITSEKNYVSFNSAEIATIAPSGYLVRSTLQQAVAQIIPTAYRQNFIQINRSTFINKHSITQITDTQVCTAFDKFILQDAFKKAVNNQLTIL